MELAGDIPGVAGQLDDLHQRLVGAAPSHAEAGGLQPRHIGIVHLVAVPVPFADAAPAVDLMHQGAACQPALLLPHAHGAAQLRVAAALLPLAVLAHPFGDQADDRVGGLGVVLGGVGVRQPGQVAGHIHDAGMEAIADAQIGQRLLPGELGAHHLAFKAALAKAAGHQYGVGAFQEGDALGLHRLGIDKLHLHPGAGVDAGVDEGLVQGLVGVGERHVLADHLQADAVLRAQLGLHHPLPFAQVGGLALDAQLFGNDLVQPLAAEHGGNLVDGAGVAEGHDGARLDIGEEGDLVPGFLRDFMVGAHHEHVRLQADGAEFLDGMLGGLGLGLPGTGDVRHQGQVQEERLPGTELKAQLAGRLQEGLGFDVPHSAADFHYGEVPAGGGLAHPRLDFVRNVRDDLNGGAQVVAAPFLGDDIGIDAPGGEVVVARHGGAHEALVVAQVQVCLCAVGGDEHLAMLQGAHGARVHIDVGVQLEQGDREAPRLQNGAERGGGDALPQGGNHATRNEDEPKHCPSIAPPPPSVHRNSRPGAAGRGLAV